MASYKVGDTIPMPQINMPEPTYDVVIDTVEPLPDGDTRYGYHRLNSPFGITAPGTITESAYRKLLADAERFTEEQKHKNNG